VLVFFFPGGSSLFLGVKAFSFFLFPSRLRFEFGDCEAFSTGCGHGFTVKDVLWIGVPVGFSLILPNSLS